MSAEFWAGLVARLWQAPKAPSAPPAPAPASPVLGCSAASWAAYEALLKLREGWRDVVYLDTLRKPTVGIGHLVRPEDNLLVGQKVTPAQISAFFAHDGADAMRHAVSQADYAGITDQAFLPYLASVCFQLGDNWVAKFPNTWKLICQGQYTRAAVALAETAWFEQTPTRVKDFHDALLRLKPKS